MVHSRKDDVQKTVLDFQLKKTNHEDRTRAEKNPCFPLGNF